MKVCFLILTRSFALFSHVYMCHARHKRFVAIYHFTAAFFQNDTDTKKITLHLFFFPKHVKYIKWYLPELYKYSEYIERILQQNKYLKALDSNPFHYNQVAMESCKVYFLFFCFVMYFL